MQVVSDAWKETQKELLLPEQFIEIEYTVTDPDAQGDGAASSNGEMEFATTADILETDLYPTLYATLEHNIWSLDGNMNVLPDASPYGDGGFISEVLSGSDGTFASIPTVTVKFSQVHTPLVPGITIRWSDKYDEYASKYRITVLNNGTQVSQDLYEGNTEVWSFADADLQDYDEIIVEVLQWSKPYHRARMEYFTIGTTKTYTKNDLMSYSHTQSVDLLSGTLPKASITFSLDNTDGKWNPDNVEGAEQYLLERQRLRVKYGLTVNGEVEWIKAGTFYMSEWSTPMNGLEATFTARDVIEFMNAEYTGARKGTLFYIAFAALGLADITDFYLDDRLSDISTDFSADDNSYTISEVLQMVANAGQCVMYQDRNGVLRIEPINETLTDYVISKDVSYAHPEYDISKELRAVSVNEGKGYAENATVGEIQTVSNPLITDDATAQSVAEWTKDIIKRRRTISGEFRADVRMDALDKITVSSKYADKEVQITDVTYSLTGGFKGTYVGRVV